MSPTNIGAPPPRDPSPPFRAEREGPGAERREGEVGIGERSGIPHLTPTLSAPEGGEGGRIGVFGWRASLAMEGVNSYIYRTRSRRIPDAGNGR
jgi:hypothetical protein